MGVAPVRWIAPPPPCMNVGGGEHCCPFNAENGRWEERVLNNGQLGNHVCLFFLFLFSLFELIHEVDERRGYVKKI